MINFLYNYFFIPLSRVLLPLYSVIQPKLKEREKECWRIFDSINFRHHEKKVIWFHSASMGEFEQAKPVIEKIKSINKNIIIICTFFSPSGFNNQKNYLYADYILYLPFDTKKNVRKFLNKFSPDIAIFVRYEIWFNYLKELNKLKTTSILINATIPAQTILNHNFFANYYYKNIFNLLTKIYTVGDIHSNYFKNLNITSEIITLNDTRFDRVYSVVKNLNSNIYLKREYFNVDDIILVAGSSWIEDENIILNSIELVANKNIRLILVPHEPTKDHISSLQARLPNSILLSQISNIDPIIDSDIQKQIDGRVIIVDSIGKLLSLYSVADIAYIGGAFGDGVHSVVEPACYGIPLCCGPKMTNSPDAVNLVNLNALEIIKNQNDFINWLLKNSGLASRLETGKISKDYVLNSIGSTDIISDNIIEQLNI